MLKKAAYVILALIAVCFATGAISLIDLTTQVKGLLPVANGGIGVGTLSGVPTGNGTSALTVANSHQLTLALNCADVSASGTAQSCTTSPSFTPAANDCVIYTTTTANTGASLTLNVNAQGAKPVAKWQGTTTLAANDVLANKQVVTCYDGTNWELSTVGTAPSGSGTPTYPLTVAGTVTSGGIPYFNSITQSSSSGLLTLNAFVKGGGAGAAPTSSLFSDNGTTASYTGTGGITAVVFTGNGSTAGFYDLPQGSTSSAVTACATASSICHQAPTSVTKYLVTEAGAASSGLLMNVNAANSITQSFSGSFGAVRQTSQTASIATATLCAATANTACGQAGQYRISYNFWGSGTACSSVTAGKVVLTFTWTDENGTAHTTIPAPILFDQKSAAGNVTGTFNFNTALGTEGASGAQVISTNGTVIQYATTFTACTTGTGTYNLRITTEPLQ